MNSECMSAPSCPVSSTSAALRVAVDTSASPSGLADLNDREDGLVEDDFCRTVHVGRGVGRPARAGRGVPRRERLRNKQPARSRGRAGISAFGRVDDETLQRDGVNPGVPRLYSIAFPNIVGGRRSRSGCMGALPKFVVGDARPTGSGALGPFVLHVDSVGAAWNRHPPAHAWIKARPAPSRPRSKTRRKS